MSTVSIPLTQDKIATVDAEDYPLIASSKWFATRDRRGRWYAARDKREPGGKQRRIWMHHVVMGVAPPIIVDHVDGNGLHNCRSNLRVATESQNRSNRATKGGAASGFRGVHLVASGRWVAVITHQYRKMYIGTFDTPQEAARAYNEKAEELFGVFARQNVV